MTAKGRAVNMQQYLVPAIWLGIIVAIFVFSENDNNYRR